MVCLLRWGGEKVEYKLLQQQEQQQYKETFFFFCNAHGDEERH
jgi:hypothetical protein